MQVNFAAQTEYECLANYRLLQRAHRDMTRSKVPFVFKTLSDEARFIRRLPFAQLQPHAQLADWWKIVSDEGRAWDLLSAMSKAVEGAVFAIACLLVSWLLGLGTTALGGLFVAVFQTSDISRVWSSGDLLPSGG